MQGKLQLNLSIWAAAARKSEPNEKKSARLPREQMLFGVLFAQGAVDLVLAQPSF